MCESANNKPIKCDKKCCLGYFFVIYFDDSAHKPLIVKGARQIGKTESILHFANENYGNVVYINFVLDKKYSTIVSDGYDVETVIKNTSWHKTRRIQYWICQ